MSKGKKIQSSDLPVPIVAIGASAGGLEAISEILENLSPTTGLAYVYIQHLSPNFESQLSNILGRVTDMPVKEAEHMLRILPDHVYIIPPNKDMEVIDGVLTLMERRPQPEVHLPIDQFFLSLSERQKDGAIAILLSGMGHDGILGMKAIKVAGGITIVQDESAKYQSMPKSAIAEDVVDLVLSPGEIASELERLSGKAEIFRLTAIAEKEQADESADQDLSNILQYLKTAIGVDFDHYKVTTIRRRVVRRMLLYKLETLKDYIEYIKSNPGEAHVLYGDLLINVTNFFRDSNTMDYLKKELFPQLIKNKSLNEPMRIWIAGCSTGQEAYSLAIILLEILGDRASTMPIQIFASDLSEVAITRARLGTYGLSEVQDVSSKRLQRFFVKVDDHYRIIKEVRDMCVFAPHNVLRDPPFSRLDMISCRNLLIYLDTILQQKVIATFHYALNPGGILLLGKSEAVSSSPSLFTQIDKNHKIFTRRNVASSSTSFELRPRLFGSMQEKHDFKRNESKIMPVAPGNELDKMVDSLLLNKYVPVSIVVDLELEILQFRGATGLFLEPSPGKPSFNLLKMARPTLVFELRNIIHKAHKSGKPVRKTGLEIKIKDETHQVEIEAVPLFYANEQNLFLILFDEVTHHFVSKKIHPMHVTSALKD
ncbi:CheR family methyltransferase [Dyadobacter sp. NIV53]|uniref:CheR family methyltransferase n=1 Tax=Dyadobacter sp. NIV53 TaxID=2861765 RepID=UPI001C879299|nr:CheR family methyltransferase [Dyadobacter sp. NIV53]